MHLLRTSILAAIAVSLATTPLSAQKLELNKGDHICYVGNTLADRMQHDGWLETLIQSRFPDKELVFRNLGFSADEVNNMPRSDGFGSHDDHLKRCKADVIFAFFGYNEATNGVEQSISFKQNLQNYIDARLNHKYNEKNAPRIVLFSPIAHENLNDHNLPDGTESNSRLKVYTTAMAEVAAKNNLPFVDLYTPTQKLYESAKNPLTLNGIHLLEHGNRAVAEVIERSLFESGGLTSDESLQRIRGAVLEKNLHWFNRYRSTDGNDVHGSRSGLRFIEKQSNFEVLQREMEIRDIMTANRDKAIWAVAKGGTAKPDDSNTPPQLVVKPNRTGPGPDGNFIFHSGEEAISKMKVAEGMTINLFASEKEFPRLINPVQMSVDPQGRVWAAAWTTYPLWRPDLPLNDCLLILPDENRDGKADKCIVFADGLHNPTGFEFWNGGVLVANAPNILFLKDTDGDGKADVKMVYLSGIDSADTHHTSNNFALSPGGDFFFAEGVFHSTTVESPWGKPYRMRASHMMKFNPRAHTVNRHFGIGPNPHGDEFDRWGNHFASDGTGGTGYYISYPGEGAMGQLYQKSYRPVPAIGILDSSHFPEANRGNLLICNAIGFQGVAQYKFNYEGAVIKADQVDTLMVSSDTNFRPTDVVVGEDGALYISDWQNPLIGHMQHNIRDPHRDHEHGRVYRVTVNGRELLPAVKIAGEPIGKLLDVLKHPDNGPRHRARIELSAHNSKAVTDAATSWAKTFDPKKQEDGHHLLEALWLHQQHRIVNEDLLKTVMTCAEPRARAAATRVLRDWAGKVKSWEELLMLAAKDEEAVVRSEAAVAAAWFEGVGAAEAVFEIASRPADPQLSHNIEITRKKLNVDQLIDDALTKKATLSPAARTYALAKASNGTLLKMERAEDVCRAILGREGVSDRDRSEVLEQLSALTRKGSGKLLLELIGANAEGSQSVFSELARMLYALPKEQLDSINGDLNQFASNEGNPGLRSAALAALVQSGEAGDSVFKKAATSRKGVISFLAAIPLIPDAKNRSALYPQVKPLLDGLPKELADKDGDSGGFARFVRIELPRNGTLTLAEVQIFGDGTNVALKKKATQSSRADNASKAIDGGTSGVYNHGTATHTNENENNPFWEVDLLGEYPVDKIVVWNRIDCCWDRLNDFTLSIFDGNREPLFIQEKNPAPQPKDPKIEIKVTIRGQISRAAALTLQHIPGHEKEIFGDMVHLIASSENGDIGINNILAMNQKMWPPDQIEPLGDALTTFIPETPLTKRDSPAFKSSLSLAHAIRPMLPEAKGEALLNALSDLSLQVVRLETVPEKMLYDKKTFTVTAGKPVKIIFSNPDKMPHNFLIVNPGTSQKIGILAAQLGEKGFEQQWRPESPDILHGTTMVNPGESATVSFTAPTKPGDYEYVCTFPGHWILMRGVMKVVK
ncbi:MAG: GDSL-type esterase/lipase family protein [Planctomycetota bacterium]|nr:GDSL-type esterase/lipase family protein [Planctomycetota bacterium]MDA1139981.1 GDSL-type esterase/lipase family protein [Planctomycetota bacterium]